MVCKGLVWLMHFIGHIHGRLFFSDSYLRTVYHRVFIFHMLIGLGEDKTAIDIGITMSKVKVTFVKTNKKGFRSLS